MKSSLQSVLFGRPNALSLDGTPQSANTAGATTLNVTFTQPTPNAVVVAMITLNAGGSAPGVSDVAGSTWTARRSLQNKYAWWSTVPAAPMSGNVITISWTGSVFANMYVFAVAGANITTRWDPNTGLPNTSSVNADQFITTNNYNTFLFGSYSATNANPAAGTGWTEIAHLAGKFQILEYKIVTTTQSATDITVGNPGTIAASMKDAITA